MASIESTISVIDLEILDIISRLEPCILSNIEKNLISALNEYNIGEDLKIKGGDLNIQLNLIFPDEIDILKLFFPEQLFKIKIVNKCLINNNNALLNLKLNIIF